MLAAAARQGTRGWLRLPAGVAPAAGPGGSGYRPGWLRRPAAAPRGAPPRFAAGLLPRAVAGELARRCR